MAHPEKNDIDIAKLFHWGNEFEIEDRYGNKLISAYIRLVGDAELNRARIFAVRKSKDLRKALKTEDSDERIAFISTIFEMEDKTELINLLLAVLTKQIAQEAIREVKIPTPKEPKSDATLEEQEEFQEQVDTYDDRRNEAVGKYILTKLEVTQKYYEERTVEEIRKVYERELINELCEREMLTMFKEHCVFQGTYKDAQFKEKMFTDFDDFTNLPTEIKEQYLNCYDSLELNIDQLKKSLEAMQ